MVNTDYFNNVIAMPTIHLAFVFYLRFVLVAMAFMMNRQQIAGLINHDDVWVGVLLDELIDEQRIA
jgi:hypothetical protein